VSSFDAVESRHDRTHSRSEILQHEKDIVSALCISGNRRFLL